MDGNNGITGIGPQPVSGTASQQSSNAVNAKQPGNFGIRQVFSVPPDRSISMSIMTPPGSFVKVDVSDRYVAVTTVNTAYLSPPMSPEARQILFDQGVATLAEVKGYTIEEAANMVERGMAWAETGYGPNDRKVENAFMGWVNNAPDRSDNPNFRTADDTQASSDLQKFETQTTTSGYTKTAVAKEVAEQVAEEVTEVEGNSESTADDILPTAVNTTAMPDGSMSTDFNTSDSRAGTNDGDSQQEPSVSTQPVETGDSTDGNHTAPDADPGSVTRVEDSGKSATVDHPTTDTNTMASSEASELVDINTSVWGAGINEGGTQPVQQESTVSTQPVATGDSIDGDHTGPNAGPGSVTKAEDSGKSATVDHPTTDTNTMASSEASERVDINTSVGWAGINKGGMQPVLQESTVSTQTMETGDSTDGDYTDPDAGPGLVTGAENSNESTTKTAVAEQVAEQAAEDVTEKVAVEVTEVEGDSESTGDDILPTAIDTTAMPDGSIPTGFNTSDSRAGTNDDDSQQESSVSSQPVETGDSADGDHTDPDADPGSVTRTEDPGKSATVDHPTTDTNTMASSEASERFDINTSVGGAGINEGGTQPVQQESTVSTQTMETGNSTDGDYTDPDAGPGLVTGAENSNESTTKTAVAEQVAEQAAEDVTEKVAVEVTEGENDSESTADDNLPTAIGTTAMPDGSMPTDFNTSDSRTGTNDGDSQQESSVSTQPVETGDSADGGHTDPDADPGSVTRAEDSGKSATADHPTTDTNTMASSEASEGVDINTSVGGTGINEGGMQPVLQESTVSTQAMETGDSTDGDYTDPDASPGLVTGAENSNESTTKTAVAEQVAEQAAEDVTEKVAVEVTEVEGDSESTADDNLPTAIDTTAMLDGSMPTDFNTSDSRAGTNDGDSQQESSVSTQPVETSDSADGDHTDPDADPGSVTRAEDSGKSATVDHPTTDTNTMASSEASEPVNTNASISVAGTRDAQTTQQESIISPVSPVLISPLASEVSFPFVISNQSEERPETASLNKLQETTVSNERNGLLDEKLSGQLDESPADASESSSESLSESAVLHETSLQRSDDTDRLSPETLSEEAEFTTGKTGTSDSPEPIDSGYYPDDDQYGMPTLRPETPTNTGSPMNPGEEPATVDRAAEISNNSVSMAEIAQRRVKERPQFSPSQTSSIDYSPARGSKRKFSRLDWSYVESSGYGQDSKRMKISPKKISTKQRQEWTNDANFLGASTHNKLALAKEVYAKLKKNMSDLSQSKIIIETNRKYISAEGATKAPAFLQSPGKKQLAALNELGLDRHASENAILLALIDKASESIEANKNSKKHENTMLNLNKIHQDLLGKT